MVTYSFSLAKEDKCKGPQSFLKENERGEDKREGGGCTRVEKKVIWLSGGSIWFCGFLAGSEQAEAFHCFKPMINFPIFPSSSFQYTPQLKNLVWEIMAGPNNTGAWSGFGIKTGGRGGGASSDPQKTLSNKAETLRASQRSDLLFSVLRHCWGEIREFLNTAKRKEKQADLTPSHPPK